MISDWTCPCGEKCRGTWDYCPNCAMSQRQSIENYPQHIWVWPTKPLLSNSAGSYTVQGHSSAMVEYVRADLVETIKPEEE